MTGSWSASTVRPALRSPPGGRWRRRSAATPTWTCVAGWHTPYLAEAGGYGLMSVTPEDLMAGARYEAERCLEALELERQTARRAGCGVNLRMIEGDAGEMLVTESKGALMLVVGRHGRGARGPGPARLRRRLRGRPCLVPRGGRPGRRRAPT